MRIAAVADVGDIGSCIAVLATRPAVGQLHIPVVGDFLLPPGIDGLVMAIDAVPGFIETRATRDVGSAAVVEDGATIDIQLVVLILIADLGAAVLAFPTQLWGDGVAAVIAVLAPGVFILMRQDEAI